MYQMYEAMSREREREHREHAATHRLAGDCAVAQRWSWLARFATRRAESSQRRLAEHDSADYQLAG